MLRLAISVIDSGVPHRRHGSPVRLYTYSRSVRSRSLRRRAPTSARSTVMMRPSRLPCRRRVALSVQRREAASAVSRSAGSCGSMPVLNSASAVDVSEPRDHPLIEEGSTDGYSSAGEVGGELSELDRARAGTERVRAKAPSNRFFLRRVDELADRGPGKIDGHLVTGHGEAGIGGRRRRWLAPVEAELPKQAKVDVEGLSSTPPVEQMLSMRINSFQRAPIETTCSR